MPDARAPGRRPRSTGGTNPAAAGGAGPAEPAPPAAGPARAGAGEGAGGGRPGPGEGAAAALEPLERTLRLHRLYDLYRGLLTPRQQDVFELYHWQDLSLGEVAEHLGISRQAVHDLLRRSEALLEETEGVLGLGAWRQRAAGHLDRLEAALGAAAAAAGAGGPAGRPLQEALAIVQVMRRELEAGPVPPGANPGGAERARPAPAR